MRAMTQFPKTSGWPERIWRNANIADIARGLVPGARPFAAFGEHISSGTTTGQVVWETGMPATLTVPAGIGLSLVSTSASDVGRRLKLAYLDGDLLARTETITLNGLTPVATAATDIRFVNNLYSIDGPVAGAVTATNGGITYARMPVGDVQYNAAVFRVPANKRLMLTALYASSVSGTSASKTVVKIETSFFNGDAFADQGILHPIGGVGFQDDTTTLSFGPFPIPPGEIVAMTYKTDKGADVTGGFFGWIEDI